MGVAVHDSNLHSEQASGLELRGHIAVPCNWQWDGDTGGGKKRSRWRIKRVHLHNAKGSAESRGAIKNCAEGCC